MKFRIWALVLVSAFFNQALAKNLTLACKLFDSSKIGGTYYEAEILDKNTITGFKVIDVTGGISSLISSNKGPFVGKENVTAKNSYWKNHMKYTNVTQGDCRQNECLTLVVPENLPSFLSRPKFSGYVGYREDHGAGANTIFCQVY